MATSLLWKWVVTVQATLTRPFETLAKKAKFWGVTGVVYESNFGDGMFGQLLKPVFNRIYPCAIDEVRNTSQKELRIIDTLEPVMMRHKMIFNKSVINDDYQIYETNPAYSLIYQMTRLTSEHGALAHDDRLDALAIGVTYWQEVMDRIIRQGWKEYSR